MNEWMKVPAAMSKNCWLVCLLTLICSYLTASLPFVLITIRINVCLYVQYYDRTYRLLLVWAFTLWLLAKLPSGDVFGVFNIESKWSILIGPRTLIQIYLCLGTLCSGSNNSSLPYAIVQISINLNYYYYYMYIIALLFSLLYLGCIHLFVFMCVCAYTIATDKAALGLILLYNWELN